MVKASKQADRNAAKRAAKKEESADGETVSGADPWALIERSKTLLLGSCAAWALPELKDLLADGVAPNGHGTKPAAEKTNGEEAAAEGEEAKADGDEGEGKKAPKEGGDAALESFANICAQLHLFNILGLAEPATPEAAKQAWLDLKGLELDWGPRSKKRGTPATDRILENFENNLPQYFHILLALMVLRAFLFRSWFACLPWLIVYQFASIFIPLEGIPQLPQVPIEKCPVKFRVAGTMALHTLMWIFFLMELVYRTYFLEKFLVSGLFVYHAYAVRPAGK